MEEPLLVCWWKETAFFQKFVELLLWQFSICVYLNWYALSELHVIRHFKYFPTFIKYSDSINLF